MNYLKNNSSTNGHYEKKNCRWADKYTQANNTRTNRLIKYEGKTHTMANWCRLLGLNYHQTAQRLNRDKWSIERAFNEKEGKQNVRLS